MHSSVDQTGADFGRPTGGAAHPEEMRAMVDLRLGHHVRLRATARTTPAGLAAVGLMVSSILVAVAIVVRAAGQRERRHP